MLYLIGVSHQPTVNSRYPYKKSRKQRFDVENGLRVTNQIKVLLRWEQWSFHIILKFSAWNSGKFAQMLHLAKIISQILHIRKYLPQILHPYWRYSNRHNFYAKLKENFQVSRGGSPTVTHLKIFFSFFNFPEIFLEYLMIWKF